MRPLVQMQPLAQWQELSQGKLAAGGDAPQLAVGHAMFGTTGYVLMAIASLEAARPSMYRPSLQ